MKNLTDIPLLGRLLALPTNNRLSWKGLPGTNTLAYYKNARLTAVNRFITLAPDMQQVTFKKFWGFMQKTSYDDLTIILNEGVP